MLTYETNPNGFLATTSPSEIHNLIALWCIRVKCGEQGAKYRRSQDIWVPLIDRSDPFQSLNCKTQEKLYNNDFSPAIVNKNVFKRCLLSKIHFLNFSNLSKTLIHKYEYIVVVFPVFLCIATFLWISLLQNIALPTFHLSAKRWMFFCYHIDLFMD